jgi:DNA-binding NtrC family response regulator
MLEARTERRAQLESGDATVSTMRRAWLATPAPPGRLSIVFPRALAASHEVGERPFVLGRQGDAEILHGTVSRAHVAIAWSSEAGAYMARDLDSHNGSMLDGAPLGRRARPLSDGSVLRLGNVLAVWECSGALDEGDVAVGDAGDAVPGRAARMQALRAQIARAAADRAPVLIVGETGSGKERVARELHRQSGRTGPMIAINCAALQPSLIESELFGHGRGAFTGACEAQRGYFREAHGGTLFLDEIGELSTALQAKLLRAIQEQEVQPVGGGDPVAVDVRVIAATHRNPAEAIAAGILREDLYARLSLWELQVPALRERRIDLQDWLVRLHAARPGGAPRPLPPLSVDAVETLLIQRWPLNLRALERLVRELATRPADRTIELCDLPSWLDTAAPAAPGEMFTATLDTTLDPPREAQVDLPARVRAPIPTRDEFVAAFEQLGGSVRALARHFGRDRRQIYRWIEAHGVREPR